MRVAVAKRLWQKGERGLGTAMPLPTIPRWFQTLAWRMELFGSLNAW